MQVTKSVNMPIMSFKSSTILVVSSSKLNERKVF
jgi:hypothetical protein